LFFRIVIDEFKRLCYIAVDATDCTSEEHFSACETIPVFPLMFSTLQQRFPEFPLQKAYR